MLLWSLVWFCSPFQLSAHCVMVTHDVTVCPSNSLLLHASFAGNADATSAWASLCPVQDLGDNNKDIQGPWNSWSSKYLAEIQANCSHIEGYTCAVKWRQTPQQHAEPTVSYLALSEKARTSFVLSALNCVQFGLLLLQVQELLLQHKFLSS